jgi:hypothetical protein
LQAIPAIHENIDPQKLLKVHKENKFIYFL